MLQAASLALLQFPILNAYMDEKVENITYKVTFVCMCVYVCVCMCLYISMYVIYVCGCMYVCVCMYGRMYGCM